MTPHHVSKSGPHFRVLLIEDDPRDARIIRARLAQADAAVDLIHVTSLAAAGPHLVDASIDAILLDLNLPDGSGLQAVATVLAGNVRQPLLVLTGQSENNLAVDALRLGAQDYLLKDALDGESLCRALRHAIERQRLLECRRESLAASYEGDADLRQLLLHGSEALLVVGGGGRIHFANQQAEELFGRPASELMSRPCEIGGAAGAEVEAEIVRPDGSRVLTEQRSVNVLWRSEPALLVSLRDVSDRRRTAEQQVRFELLTNFLNNMSHELRTPLAAVYQLVSNVRDELSGPLTPEQRSDLGAALRNVDEVLGMVANLLDVARSQGGSLRIEPRVMHLAGEIQTVCGVLREAARKAGVRFEVSLPGGLPPLLADPPRIRQVIANWARTR